MKKQKPSDVTVSNALREWSQKQWGCPFLPDVFLSEFKEHHEASGKTFASAEKAFQNWIRWSSPSGRFYSAQGWESKLAKAKTIQLSRRIAQTPAYDPRGPQEPRNERSAADVARMAIANMRARMQA